jgi:hypothetical protein
LLAPLYPGFTEGSARAASSKPRRCWRSWAPCAQRFGNPIRLLKHSAPCFDRLSGMAAGTAPSGSTAPSCRSARSSAGPKSSRIAGEALTVHFPQPALRLRGLRSMGRGRCLDRSGQPRRHTFTEARIDFRARSGDKEAIDVKASGLKALFSGDLAGDDTEKRAPPLYRG